VAAAPAANPATILALNPPADKLLGPYVAASYSRFYSDITFEQAVQPAAREAAGEMAKLCGLLPPGDPERLRVLATSFKGGVLTTSTNAALAARLAQNTANQPIAAPVVIAQGLADEVVPPAATDAYVDVRCRAGQRLEYWRFAAANHAGIVQPGTPLEEPLIAWTRARFANEPQPSGCARRSW
jgi:hypothetical protein